MQVCCALCRGVNVDLQHWYWLARVNPRPKDLWKPQFSDTGPLNGDLFCLTGVLQISCLPWSHGSPPASAALDTSAWEWPAKCVLVKSVPLQSLWGSKVVQAFSIAGDERGGNCRCPSLLKRKGWAFGLAVEVLVGMTASHIRIPDVSWLCSSAPSNFLLTAHPGRQQVPAIHVRDPDWIPSSWLLGIWGNEPLDESSCLSKKQFTFFF